MGKFFGKGTSVDTIFNLKEGVTSASSLNDYDFSTIKEAVKNNLDPEPIIFISDPNYGNFIWANGQFYGEHNTYSVITEQQVINLVNEIVKI